MKKLTVKDKKLVGKLKTQEQKHFVLKAIYHNSNFFTLIRWNAYLRLKSLGEKSSKVSIQFRCLYTVNRERFHVLVPFSRHVFLKLVRSGKVSGFRKSSW